MSQVGDMIARHLERTRGHGILAFSVRPRPLSDTWRHEAPNAIRLYLESIGYEVKAIVDHGETYAVRMDRYVHRPEVMQAALEREWERAHVGPCPWDTDGDGDCGRRGCPLCGARA